MIYINLSISHIKKLKTTSFIRDVHLLDAHLKSIKLRKRVSLICIWLLISRAFSLNVCETASSFILFMIIIIALNALVLRVNVKSLAS